MADQTVQEKLEQKMAMWVDRGVCPRAGHELASEEDLYVVPSSGNVQCRECRKEIRRSYRVEVKEGRHVPIAGAYQGTGVAVNAQPVADAARKAEPKKPAKKS